MRNLSMLVSFSLTTAILATPSVCRGQVNVTEQQVAEVRAKLMDATRYMILTWKEFFADRKFYADKSIPPFPKILPYRNSVRSACGILGAENALFCYADNTVSYDEVFLTRLTRLAGASLGTDGDYAAVVALAHEVGHAFRYALQVLDAADTCNLWRRGLLKGPASQWCVGVSRTELWETSYDIESQADCFAGAITKHFKDGNLLDPGDFEEGEFTLAFVADPTVVETPHSVKRLIYGHGKAADRRKNFGVGYRLGVDACKLTAILAEEAK
jgi:predicted metalloprotease